MSVIAEFAIASDGFALGSIVAGEPEMSVELDRIVPAADGGVPYLWASGGGFEEFERLFEASPLIRSITPVDRIDDSVLYRIEWTGETESLLWEIGRSNVTVLEAFREGDWFFRLRFDDHDDLSRFHGYCSEHDVNYRLTRVYPDPDRQSRTTAFGLTPEQRDTLVLAVERGYFHVPREVTLRELADEFDISQQAASERIRRAADRVLGTVLVTPLGDAGRVPGNTRPGDGPASRP